MEAFEHEGGKVPMVVHTGTVIGSQKHSRTHVYSSGGGGFVQSGTGYVSAPTVSSTVSTTHEIWIRTAGGEEIPAQIESDKIPLAEGQHVSLIFANLPLGKEKHPLLQLVNHSARQRWTMNNGIPTIVNAVMPAPSAATIVTIVVLAAGGAYVMPALAWLAWGYGGYAFYRRRKRKKVARAELGPYLERLVPFESAVRAAAEG